jgi:hypothetical protein
LASWLKIVHYNISIAMDSKDYYDDDSLACDEEADVKIGVARTEIMSDDEDNNDDPYAHRTYCSNLDTNDDRKPAATSKAHQQTSFQAEDEKTAYREQLDVALHILEHAAACRDDDTSFAATSPGAVAVAGFEENDMDNAESVRMSVSDASRPGEGGGHVTATTTLHVSSGRALRAPGAVYVPRVAPGFDPLSMPLPRQEPVSAFVVTPVEAQLMQPQESYVNEARTPKDQHKMWYIGLAIVVFILIAVTVGVGVSLGTKNKSNESKSSNDVTNKNSPKSFDPVTIDCNSLQTEVQPNVWSQCNCTGAITMLSADTVQRYQSLVNTFVDSVLPNFTETINSCSPQNQALVWLASFNGATMQSNYRQRYALALLFTLWNGPDWISKTGWMSSADECTWYGLLCNKQREVISITLSTNNMVVDLKSVAGFLTMLESLTVDTNTLQGKTIPTEVGLLTNLNTLTLSSTNIKGTLPTELYNLKLLEQFDVSTNSLSGTISTLIGNLLNLRKLLTMACHQRRNNVIVTIALTLKISLPVYSPETLDLYMNALTGTIPTEIGRCSNLVTLFLDHNRLNGTLPTELGKLQAVGKCCHHWHGFSTFLI